MLPSPSRCRALFASAAVLTKLNCCLQMSKQPGILPRLSTLATKALGIDFR